MGQVFAPPLASSFDVSTIVDVHTATKTWPNFLRDNMFSPILKVT